jgi:hypothetical protein
MKAISFFVINNLNFVSTEEDLEDLRQDESDDLGDFNECEVDICCITC